MRRHTLAGIALLLWSGACAAAGDWSWYGGAGAALLHPLGAGNGNAVNALGRVGLENARFPAFALEGELGATLSSGKFAGRDFKLDSAAAYLAWRSPGAWYLKLRAGALLEHARVGGGTSTDSGLSGGVGGGYRFAGNRRLELEFTVVEHEVRMLSLVYCF